MAKVKGTGQDVMPRALRDAWCEALRSGDHTQTTGWLYDEQDYAYCCLGVLQGPVLGFPVKGRYAPGNTFMYGPAADQAGLRRINTRTAFRDAPPDALQTQLARLNDEVGFEEIADWIEVNVPVED